MRCLAIALLACPATASAQNIWPKDEPFATTQIQGWRAQARTYASSGRANLPAVANIACSLDTNGLRVTLDRAGKVSVAPNGVSAIDANGDEEQFDILNVRALRLDGVGYETKAVSTIYLPWRFTDIDYPREENDDIMLSMFSGYLAIRRGPDSPWLPMSTLLDQLIASDAIDIGFLNRSAKNDEPPRLLHFRAKLTGLGPALSWCQTQFASDRAFRIKP